MMQITGQYGLKLAEAAFNAAGIADKNTQEVVGDLIVAGIAATFVSWKTIDYLATRKVSEFFDQTINIANDTITKMQENPISSSDYLRGALLKAYSQGEYDSFDLGIKSHSVFAATFTLIVFANIAARAFSKE